MPKVSLWSNPQNNALEEGDFDGGSWTINKESLKTSGRVAMIIQTMRPVRFLEGRSIWGMSLANCI